MEGSATSSNDRLPQVLLSAAELIKFRDDRKAVVFTMVNGQTIEGVIRWYDAEAIHVATPERSEVTLLKHSILFYGAQ